MGQPAALEVDVSIRVMLRGALLVFTALAYFLIGQAGSARASEFRLSLPVDCELGRVCTLQNYVDREPGPEARDYTCGRLVYDGHKGTDFRLPDVRWLERDVAILAAAPGVIRGLRNNVRDHTVTTYDRKKVEGQECGNGVVIDHGGGWETQYCHLRFGSVTVAKGDRVRRGQRLGIMGLTGKTEYPHLHMSVRYQGKVVDPFVGPDAVPGCGVKGQPIWEPGLLDKLAYRPSGILGAGFTDQKPRMADILSGEHRYRRLSRDAANLIFWVLIYGLQPGDEMDFRITDPTGRQITKHRSKPAKKHKIRWFSFAGKRGRGAWPAGTYTGEYRLLRQRQGQGQGQGRGQQVIAVETSAKVELK